MKSNEFSEVLARASELVEGLGQSHDANRLADLAIFFSSAGTQSVKAVLKKCGVLEATEAGVFGMPVGRLSNIVRVVTEFVKHTGKKALATDLDDLSQWLQKYEQADFKDLLGKAEAALTVPVKKNVATKSTAATAAAIGGYLQRLDETFGFEGEFEAVF